MIISCPNCYARFTLPVGAMPADGRKVRCSSCSNVWHAMPDDAEEQPVDNFVESEATDPLPENTADKLAAIRSAMEDDATDNMEDEPASPYESDNSSDEDKLEIEEEGNSFDTSDFGYDNDDDADDIAPLGGGVSDPEDIDHHFTDDLGEDEFAEPFPIEDFDEDEDFDDEEDFDDDLITRRRRKQREEAEYRAASRRSQMAAVGWVFLILFLGTSIGLFVAVPDKVKNWWPASQDIYDIVGVSTEAKPVLADVTATPNVEIKIQPPVLIAQGNGYNLPLNGTLTNNGQRSVTIPALSYSLSDLDGNEIGKGSFCLPSRILGRGQSVEFEHLVQNASDKISKSVINIIWEKDTSGKPIDSCAANG